MGLHCLVAGGTGATGVHIVALVLRSPLVSQVTVLARRALHSVDSETRALWADPESASAFSKKLWFREFGDGPEGGWGTDSDSDEAVVANLAEIMSSPRTSATTSSTSSEDEGRRPASVDIVFTAMGTSRANPEVRAAMNSARAEAGSEAAGFEKWLREVDLRRNVLLARAAAVAGAVKAYSRISAASADVNAAVSPEKTFSYYFKYQGLADEKVLEACSGRRRDSASSLGLASSPPIVAHILRPGALDRGEQFRAKREWEVARHASQGPGLDVKHLAKVAVAMALAEVAEAGDKGSVHIVDEGMIRNFDADGVLARLEKSVGDERKTEL
eukprot:g3859.t1